MSVGVSVARVTLARDTVYVRYARLSMLAACLEESFRTSAQRSALPFVSAHGDYSVSLGQQSLAVVQ